ncbi:MAG: amino acid-binding protein [Eggerthellaceae bacterium]|jgi:hypothetical protein|nr:amino acid-binding protein [Eggerthellaceae bacterium]MDR2721779.1 hypothetical protein [Coriobacteriaceae bacterium]
MISQLTVFIENRKGHLAQACRVIADEDINMRALFLADTTDFGIARIFCDCPEKAAEALRGAGFRAKVIDVLGVRVPDRKGGLAELLEFLDRENVDVEYGYCFSINENFAIDVLKVNDASIELRLVEAGYALVQSEEVYALDDC